jgi:hypothetical protein
MTYRKFFTKEAELQEVLARLEELYSIKLERFKTLPTNSTEEGETPAWTERKALDRLSRLIENFRSSINYGESELEENEQLSAIDALMKEISREAGYGYGNKDRVQQLRAYFETLKNNKHKAYSIFAQLVDDQRIKLLAVQFLLESVPHSATHRVKDFKIGMVQETLRAIVEDLSLVDKDHPDHYDWRRGDLGSWDYTKALKDLHHKKSNIERLEKELEEARAKLAQYEPPAENGKEPVRDEVTF